MVELCEVKLLDTALKLASVMPLWNMATVSGLHLLLIKWYVSPIAWEWGNNRIINDVVNSYKYLLFLASWNLKNIMK